MNTSKPYRPAMKVLRERQGACIGGDYPIVCKLMRSRRGVFIVQVSFGAKIITVQHFAEEEPAKEKFYEVLSACEELWRGLCQN